MSKYKKITLGIAPGVIMYSFLLYMGFMIYFLNQPIKPNSNSNDNGKTTKKNTIGISNMKNAIMPKRITNHIYLLPLLLILKNNALRSHGARVRLYVLRVPWYR